MADQLRDRTLALAGIYQALDMVCRIARDGEAPQHAMKVVLQSIFVSDAETTDEVYGTAADLADGLKIVATIFNNPERNRDMEITAYLVTAIQLERVLSSHTKLLDDIGREIELLAPQLEQVSVLDMEIIHGLASIYRENISALTPRIIVHGEPHLLADEDKAATIRALLLGALRSAVLWRQKGGTRLKLLFGRQKAARIADAILREVRH
jgi:high frequency lysogenization protein